MYSIDNVRPNNLTLFLAKPDKTTIGKLKHIKNENLTIKSDEVNELSFTLPYEITVNGKQIKNPHIANVRDKYLIRSEFGGKKEWFLIDDIKRVSEESEDLQVNCFSLGYQLQYHLVIDYEATSYNCKMVSDDILKGTGWKTGYVNPEFNLKYRRFDISSQTKLATIFEIRDTFDAVVIFDTEEKTVSYYKQEEVSQYKGFNIGYGKYIQNIEEDIDADEIVTRLYVYGSDGLTVNSVNPTGQSYIDDFSYFLYPFAMDEDENVISHSDYMSDSLAKELVKYNQFVSERKDTFGKLLGDKSKVQQEVTEKRNELKELEKDLQIILDAIIIARDIGNSTANLARDRNAINKEIDSKKSEIAKLESQIGNIDGNMQGLRADLRMENHLNEDQMNELYNFIQMDEWTDENQFDANDLYEAGMEEIDEINKPPINITTNLVNFLSMVSEKHNWDRFAVHDIIRIDHEKLGIDIKATLSEISIDFEGQSIGVTISNTNRARSVEDKIKDAFYTINKVDTDHNRRKINWDRVAYNFNLRNDRIEEIPVDPTNAIIAHKANDDGSVNLVLNWNYPEHTETKKNEHNIDGFLIYMYSDNSDEPYQFTSKMSQETIVDIALNTNSYTFPSVPSNLFYTVGLRAYRRVDEDINSDGILMSEITRFEAQSAMSTFSSIASASVASVTDDTNNLSNPYQPSPEINIKGRINGVRITTDYEVPTNPLVDDIWIDLEHVRTMVFDGIEWVGDKDLETLKETLAEHEAHMTEMEEQIKEELSQAEAELEEAQKVLEEEMKWLEEEVIPNVERAIEETSIPDSVDPPEEIPASGLWWNMAEEPPRLMRWDDEQGNWGTLAPTEGEVEDIMQQMRDEAVVESTRYSKIDTLKVRKQVTDKIDAEMEIVSQNIEELEEMTEALKQRATDTEQLVTDLEGEIGESIEGMSEITTALKTRVEEAEETVGDMVARVEELGDLKDIVDSHTSYIEQTDETIRLSVERITGTEGRLDIAETSIEEHAEAINLSATKKEVEHVDGKIEGISEEVATLKITAEGISTEVGRVETDLDGKITDNSTLITQTADAINTRIENFETAYSEDQSGIVETIEQNRLDIETTAKGLDLRVTTEQYQIDNAGFDERVTKTEASIIAHADSISLKAEKEDVYTKTEIDLSLGNKVETTVYNKKMGELTTSIDGISGRVEETEGELDAISGEFTTVKEEVAQLNITAGEISTEVGRVEKDLDGKITDNSTLISQTAEAINTRIDSFTTTYDEDQEGILTNIEQNRLDIEATAKGIDLLVTKEEYQADTAGANERIKSVETDIGIHAGLIEAKAEASELINYVDKQTYKNEVGSFTVGTGTIAGRVQATEVGIDTLSGEYTSFKKDYAEFVTEVDSFTTRVGHLSDDGTTLVDKLSEVTQTADGIVSTVSSIQSDLDGKASREEAIKTVVVEYYLSTSSTTTTGGSWNVTAPDWVSGRYFWSRTKTTYSDGRVSTTNPVNITGAKGDTGSAGTDGKDGRGIVDATVTYRNHTSGTSAPTSGWLSSVPSPTKGQYLWTRTVTTYTSGNPITTYSVAYNATDGQRGVDGKGITSTVVHYQLSTSGTITPTSTWLTSPPAPVKGRYLWTRTTISYSSGNPSVSYSTSYYATDGQRGEKGETGSKGADGKGIVNAVVAYQNHTNGNNAPTGSWLSTVPAPVKGRYLWTRTVTTYTDQTSVTTYSVSYTATDGQRGTDGRGIASTTVHYQLSTSGTITPTGSWLSTVPAPISGRYLWTRTVISYTSGSNSTSYSTSYHATDGQRGADGATGARGATGSTGQGVDSVTTQYYSSTSRTAQSGGSWINTQPTWVKGRYLWTRTRIIYKNPTDTSYTTPVIDNSWESLTVVETKIEQLPTEINLSVREGINDLDIGVRNFLLNSANIVVGALSYANGSRAEYRTLDLKRAWIDNCKDGDEVTISFDVQMVKGLFLQVYNTNRPGPFGFSSRTFTNIGTSKQRLSFTTKLNKRSSPSYTVDTIEFYSQYGSSDWFIITNVKLEKGNKATDWSPAPEDGVDKTNVLSSINLSTEGVKITGARIDIAGLVSVLNADGTAGTMISGNKLVTGSITANRLNVNEIFANSAVISRIQADSVKTATLDAGKITAGTLDAGRISVVNLNAASINAGTLNVDRISARSIVASKLVASTITANEIATNAIIAGKIAANAITAVKIQAGAIVADKIAANAITAAKIAAGAIVADKIAAKVITADKINVGSISAISANLGTITAGTIRGVRVEGGTIIQSGASGSILLDNSGLHSRDAGGNKRITMSTSNDSTFGFSPSVLNFEPTSSHYSFIVGANAHGMGDGFIGFNRPKTTTYRSMMIRNDGGDINFLASDVSMFAKLTIERAGEALEFRPSSAGGNHAFVSFRNGSNQRVGYIGVSSGAYENVIRVNAERDDLWLQGQNINLNPRGGVLSMAVYNRTYTATSQLMRITVNGYMGRSTSSRRYKLVEEPVTKTVNPYDLLKINPKTWFDKRTVEEYANELTTGRESEVQPLERIAGMIAEDVHDAGLGIYVTYNKEGVIDGISENLWNLLIPITRDHDDKLSELEREVRLLKHKDQLQSSQIIQLKKRVERLESLVS